MKRGLFTDSGYRFRKNEFTRRDKWYPFGTNIKQRFSDFTFYNSDTFDVGTDNIRIAEMYFRLETDQVTHNRIVKQLMDQIGAIGGLSRFLL